MKLAPLTRRLCEASGQHVRAIYRRIGYRAGNLDVMISSILFLTFQPIRPSAINNKKQEDSNARYEKT